MKIYQFVLFILAFSISHLAAAQFNFELRTTNSAVGAPGETLIITGDIENLSGADMDILITRIDESVPDDWETAMCTDVECFIPVISQITHTLLWGEYQTYSMYFYTAPGNENSGSATVTLTNLSDTTNSFTQQYFGSTSFAVSTSEVQELARQAEVYPTLVEHEAWLSVPSQLILEAENLKFQMFSSGGQLVRSFPIDDPLIRFDRNDLPSGTFFYAISSASGLLQSGKLIFP